MLLYNIKCLRPYLLYFAASAAHLLSFTGGLTYSWAATIAPKLNSTDSSVSPLPRAPTLVENSWIVAIYSLGSVVGPLVGSLITAKLGKKRAILLIGMPFFIGHITTAFANQVWMFIIVRLFMGLSHGISFSTMASYVNDIAEDSNRGFLGYFHLAFMTGGSLFVFVLGPFVSVELFSLLSLIPIIIMCTFLVLFVPNTPYDLLMMNDVDEAKRSLAFYRGKEIAGIETEFRNLQVTTSSKKTRQKTLELLKNIFKSKPLLKGVTIVYILIILQPLSGIIAITSFLQTIFDDAGGSIESIYSVMIIGLVAMLTTALASQLVERLGRRLLTLTSLFVITLSLVGLGTYFYLKDEMNSTSSISWLPILSLVVFTIAYYLQASIPWVLLIDICSPDVIDLLSSIASSLLFLVGFVSTLCYPYLNKILGSYGTFYLFAGFTATNLIYAFLTVPEFKGKTNEEVLKMLGN